MSTNEKNSPEENNQNENKKRILIIILIILLLIFCYISYFLGYRIGKIDVVPTDVDVTSIKVTSKNMDWKIQDEIDIFANPEFDYKFIIAPFSQSSYQFVVENTNTSPIKYSIIFTDENEHKINLKYKLKMDNVYVLGTKDNWVEVSALNMNDIILANNSKTVYTLEWSWQESTDEKDTASAGGQYKLFVKLLAKDYDEV